MSLDQSETVVEDSAPRSTDSAEPLAGSSPAKAGRLGSRSLTARLVVGVVLLVTVLVGAIGATTFYSLRSFLYSRLDQQLDSSIRGTAILRLLNTPQSSGGYGVQVPQTIYVQVIADDTGVPTTYQPRSPDLSTLELSGTTLKTLAGRQTGAASRRTIDGQWIRTRSVSPLDLQSTSGAGAVEKQKVTVVIGLSESDVRRTLGRVLDIEMIIGLSAILVAFIATTGGVHFSLRRLRRVTLTAQEVATELSPTGSGLERRVPEDDPGTEVGQLAGSFNTMLAAVQTQFVARVESEQRMRQFLADASHELRTPLTSIRGYAELARMQRAVDGDVPADNLDRIESEGTRMSRLVEDLLMLARGDAAAGDPSRTEHVAVDMAGLLDDAVSGSRAAFPDRQISLDAAPMPVVIGDRDQLLRVVRNLINNAAVHTATGRPIEVRGMSRDGGVAVEVIDAGPGLPAEEAAHVFERFWRADKARTRARGGSGLGMSIVAAVTTAHGGTVRFDSTVETGSTVTVWLPASTD